MLPIMKTETPECRSSAGGVNRRGFLIQMAGGLSIGFLVPVGGRVLAAVPGGPAAAGDVQINAYVRVSTDGTVTTSFGGAEMGQGSMSGLSQILAEELKVDWNQIRIDQSLANPAVSYTTGGSSAVSRRFGPLRTAGATARELLVAGAMLSTGDTTRANYAVAAGRVSYADPLGANPARSWGYGELAAAAASPAAIALLPATIPLTPPDQFQLIGKPVPRVDIPAKTNGSAKYGLDVFLPGMVFAVIKHCPTIGGTLAKTPLKPSAAIAVVPCLASDSRGAMLANTYNAVAVVADNTWKAKNIAKSLSVSWTLPASTASVDSASIALQAQQLLATGTPMVAEPNNPTPAVADIEATVGNALLAASKVVVSTFGLPYLAHATLEVLNCSVKLGWSGTALASCEVWAPNQAALSVVKTVTALTGLTADKIVVHTTFLGGGLGRKIEQDYISQAVQVALAVKKPVKLTWMREEDFAHDQYRPTALIQVKAGLDASNLISAWSYRNVSPSILNQRGRAGLDSQAVEGAVKLHYARGANLVEWVPLPAGIPVGFWRSVGASINAFAVESMIDLLAAAAGMDPFAFRRGIITDDRALAVLDEADRQSAWRNSLPAGHAWGLAMAESFGTIVCEVVEISAPTTTSVKVNRVACVVDCGIAINPDSIEAQMQGGIVHGLNAALWGEMTFVKGVAQQTNFNRSRMMRLSEMPAVTVTIMPSQNAPSGIGEPAVPPAAPALANAYAALTGQRVTALPLFKGATMGGI